jgi:hypothetical protein
MHKPNRAGRRLLQRLQRKSDKGTEDIDYLIFGAPGTAQTCVLGKGRKTGTVFVPAVMHPLGADGAFTRAGLDKIAIGQDKGFLYVPADWLRKELAGDAQEAAKRAVVDRMVEAVRAYQPTT